MFDIFNMLKKEEHKLSLIHILRTVGSGTAVRETLATLGLEKTEKAVLLAVVTEDTLSLIHI